MKEETVTQLVSGAKSVAEVMSGAATTLTTEAINLFIFEAILGVGQAAVVFLLFAIVKKFLDTASTTCETDKGKRAYKTASIFALIGSIVYFAAVSMPHLKDIGKAMIAPNLFLAEKAITLTAGKKILGK